MNIHLLKVFITITDTGSFSKAAERLFISQPALSQNIKQLESHFGVSLIKRSAHALTLTDAGEALYAHASILLTANDVMEAAMDAFKSSFDDTLQVGATSVIGGYAVPCSIFIFKQRYPSAVIKLKLGNRRQVLEQLREDIIDVAIVEGDKPDENFISTEIHIEEMVIVAPNSEPWIKNSRLTLGDLPKLPLIMREEGSATRWAVECAFRTAGLLMQNLNIIMELNSVDSIKAAVEAGHGISILPRVAVKKELYNKALFALQVDDIAFFQSIYIVYKRKSRCHIASEFIRLMKSPANGFC